MRYAIVLHETGKMSCHKLHADVPEDALIVDGSRHNTVRYNDHRLKITVQQIAVNLPERLGASLKRICARQGIVTLGGVFAHGGVDAVIKNRKLQDALHHFLENVLFLYGNTRIEEVAQAAA